MMGNTYILHVCVTQFAKLDKLCCNSDTFVIYMYIYIICTFYFTVLEYDEILRIVCGIAGRRVGCTVCCTSMGRTSTDQAHGRARYVLKTNYNIKKYGQNSEY
jgi:hypothetical protein